MTNLCEFEFNSVTIIDDDVENYSFKVKGYKKISSEETVYYFKNDNSYKYIIKKDIVKVHVNDSTYIFDLNNKTIADIRIDAYTMEGIITTSLLNISEDLVEIKYSLELNGLRGNYHTILKLL